MARPMGEKIPHGLSGHGFGSISIPVIAQLSNPLEKSCSIHPRRLTPSDSLEERIVIAKSSIVASTIPKSQIYHGNRDAYHGFSPLDIYSRSD